MKKYHVYGVGNALVDMEVCVDDDFLHGMGISKGHMTLVDEKRQIELLANIDHRNGKWASGGSAATQAPGRPFPIGCQEACPGCRTPCRTSCPRRHFDLATK